MTTLKKEAFYPFVLSDIPISSLSDSPMSPESIRTDPSESLSKHYFR